MFHLLFKWLLQFFREWVWFKADVSHLYRKSGYLNKGLKLIKVLVFRTQALTGSSSRWPGWMRTFTDILPFLCRFQLKGVDAVFVDTRLLNFKQSSPGMILQQFMLFHHETKLLLYHFKPMQPRKRQKSWWQTITYGGQSSTRNNIKDNKKMRPLTLFFHVPIPVSRIYFVFSTNFSSDWSLRLCQWDSSSILYSETSIIQ